MLLTKYLFSRRFFAVLSLCLCAASALLGQSYPAQTITFSGDPAHSSSELLAASGLKAGASLDQAAMQAAAARLSESGMFSTIKFSFNGKELHYEVAPAASLLPARFVNFPWWEANEISAQLSAAVPLFHGLAAAESGTQRKILDALTAMLAARQIQATVTATQDVDLATGQPRFLDFRVTTPPVEIGEVAFTGNSGAFSTRLAEIAKAALHVDYSTFETPATMAAAVKNVYLDQGYLEAKVTSVARQPPTLVTEGAAEAVLVPLSIAVDEGAQYRLGQFSVSGSVLMDQAEFQSKALLKPGDVVEQDKLKRTMQSLSAPYVTRGYLRAKIAATPSLNRAARTVDYAIAVSPGDVYRIGALEVRDLDEERTALFKKIWKLNAGDPYDASYVSQFLKRNAKDLHPLDGYSAGYKQYEHEDTHIVDLVVTFRKGGPLG
jgi:outer membrane protein insertion porin family